MVVRLVHCFVLLLLVPLLSAPAEAKTGRAFRVAGLVARQLLPGSRPQATTSRDGSQAFELVGEAVEDELPLILMVTGALPGTVLEDWRPPNPYQQYRSPQLVAGLRVLDRATESLRCGVAVLEPLTEGQSLVFGGLRELYLVDADVEPRLCGTLAAVDDVWTGPGGVAGRDGVDELIIELPEANHRLDPATPAWSVPSHAFSWTQAGPLFTATTDRRLVTGEVSGFAWLELRGVDEEELVLSPWEGEGPELTPLLSRLKEQHPGLRPVSVAREGATVRLEAVFPDRISLRRFLRDLEDTPAAESVTTGLSTGSDGVTARITYEERDAAR